MIRYLDTSAALKLLVTEDESAALAATLTRCAQQGDRLVASFLLHTELHCALDRRGRLDAQAVRSLLDAVTLVDVERADLVTAAGSAWGLRSADAIHLATALRLDVDEIVTYDTELAAAARRMGLPTPSPS